MIINKLVRTFTPAYEIPWETHLNYWTKQNVIKINKIKKSWCTFCFQTGMTILSIIWGRNYTGTMLICISFQECQWISYLSSKSWWREGACICPTNSCTFSYTQIKQVAHLSLCRYFLTWKTRKQLLSIRLLLTGLFGLVLLWLLHLNYLCFKNSGPYQNIWLQNPSQ